MMVDLGRWLQFPQVVQTTLRSDVVLWSGEEKEKIILRSSYSPMGKGGGANRP